MEVTIIRRVKIHSISSNMILAQDVVDKYGRVLIASGASLKQETVFLLKKHDIDSVWVSSSTKDNQEIDMTSSLVNWETRLKLMSNVKNAFSDPNKFLEQVKVLHRHVEDIVLDLSSRKDVLLYLDDIASSNDYLFMHSVNVGLFSIVIGIIMELSPEELCILGMGGLLHDLGKTCISKDLLDKQEQLSIQEFNAIKEHSLLGYNLLRLESNIDHRISLIALQHHERVNGSGYPWRISGDRIHPLAKIVAVADVYDALTTDRVYRSRLSSIDAITIMMEGIDTQFDSAVMNAFRQVSVPYPIGNTVTLSNGLRGKIIRLNSANLIRPLVLTSKGIFNLLLETDLDIVSAIS